MSKDDSSFRAELEPLSVRHWAAFAASCAERQLGTYQFVSRVDPRLKPDVVRKAIECGWRFASGEVVSHIELNSLKSSVDQLIPDLDEDPSEFASLVLDAVGAASYLLAICLEGRVEDAVAAAECARNAVDERVLSVIHASPDGEPTPITIRPGEYETLQTSVDSHPLMQRELQKQRADVEYLQEHSSLSADDCLALRRSWPNGVKSNIDLE